MLLVLSLLLISLFSMLSHDDHLAMLVKYLSDHLALIDGILAEHLAMLVTSDS